MNDDTRGIAWAFFVLCFLYPAGMFGGIALIGMLANLIN